MLLLHKRKQLKAVFLSEEASGIPITEISISLNGSWAGDKIKRLPGPERGHKRLSGDCVKRTLMLP